MGENNKNDKTILIPPGYEYVADTLNNEEGEKLHTVFLSSVDGDFLDADNYQPESHVQEQAELPQAFKDYAL